MVVRSATFDPIGVDPIGADAAQTALLEPARASVTGVPSPGRQPRKPRAARAQLGPNVAKDACSAIFPSPTYGQQSGTIVRGSSHFIQLLMGSR